MVVVSLFCGESVSSVIHTLLQGIRHIEQHGDFTIHDHVGILMTRQHQPYRYYHNHMNMTKHKNGFHIFLFNF